MEGEYQRKVEKPWSFEICLPLLLNILAWKRNVLSKKELIRAVIRILCSARIRDVMAHGGVSDHQLCGVWCFIFRVR